jgi:hypothetical protein
MILFFLMLHFILMLENIYQLLLVYINRILNILWFSSQQIIVRLDSILLEFIFLINTEDDHHYIISISKFITTLLSLFQIKFKILKLYSMKPMNTSYRLSKIQRVCRFMLRSHAYLNALVL